MDLRTRARSSLVLGGLGVLLGLAFLVLVWRLLPPLGTRLADTIAAVRTSVEGMHARLTEVDQALIDTDGTLQALGKASDDDTPEVQAKRQRLREALTPLGDSIREDLRALRDVARGVDNLLETLDLPVLAHVGRAGGERSTGIDERVPPAQGADVIAATAGDDEEKDLGDVVLDPAQARATLGEARTRVAEWQASLTSLQTDLEGLKTRLPRLTFLLAVILTLLALWGLAGQVCLFRSGRRGLERQSA